MSNKPTEILTPVGRLVMGDCFEAQTTDAEGKPLLIKNGPNTGQPRVDYYMGIAVPKTDAGYNELWAKVHGEARLAFPGLFDAAGNCVNPKFAFKIIDGDSRVPNTKGIKPCDREGFAGHWVLNFSGGFAPKCYTAGGAEVITDPNMIKRGYFIRIYGSVKGNGSQQQPGIFLNHSMVELVGYGEEIITGPRGDAVFGGSPAGALPAGASATPVAGAAPIAQAPPPPAGAAVAPAAMAPPPATTTALPPPAATQAAPPASTVAPAPDFLNGPATAPAPAADVLYVDVNGGKFTEAQLLAVGYTAEQIAALPRG